MFAKGNFFKEQDRDGWAYGHFMDGLHKDSRLEIKLATLKKGTSRPAHYQKTATKIDIIWSGKGIWVVDGEDVVMEAGDYVIVPPKVATEIKNVISDELVVQTLKVPSVEGDKVMGEVDGEKQ